MHVINCRNVAEALPLGVDYLLQHGKQEVSRGGPVLVAPGPVATVYARPQECVLFNAVRDANPFFALLEAMWMLAGRDDAAFLNNYVKDFGERFAEPYGRIHDAYGRRWKRGLGFDQLGTIIEKLRKDPSNRQCVLQMWDAFPTSVQDIPGKTWGHEDLRGSYKTRPCNTHAYFRIREKIENPDQGEGSLVGGRSVLDMMVCCRSNDIILGCYSANACHFSILQQYLAAMIGVEVGSYTQLSWNFHAYVAELERLARRAGAAPGTPLSALRALGLPLALVANGYATAGVAPAALVDEPASFDKELGVLMEMLDELHREQLPRWEAGWQGIYDFHNRFLSETAWRAAFAMRLWRLGQRSEALMFSSQIAALDWRLACRQWFERRARKPEAVVS